MDLANEDEWMGHQPASNPNDPLDWAATVKRECHYLQGKNECLAMGPDRRQANAVLLLLLWAESQLI